MPDTSKFLVIKKCHKSRHIERKYGHTLYYNRTTCLGCRPLHIEQTTEGQRFTHHNLGLGETQKQENTQITISLL